MKTLKRDVCMLQFVEALCARVQAHTSLPIYFSLNCFPQHGAGNAITDGCYLAKRLVANSNITLLDGRITLERGLSFRFSSGESEVILILDMTEVGDVKTLKYEIWSLGWKGGCFKVPDCTAFEVLLKIFKKIPIQRFMSRTEMSGMCRRRRSKSTGRYSRTT